MKNRIALELLKLAKEISSSSIDTLSGDASDILEGIIRMNLDESVANIVKIVKKDRVIKREMKEVGMSDKDLEKVVNQELKIQKRFKKSTPKISSSSSIDVLSDNAVYLLQDIVYMKRDEPVKDIVKAIKTNKHIMNEVKEVRMSDWEIADIVKHELIFFKKRGRR
jgi:uncharacterized membrane protein YheB (UPF0754 family)